MDGIIDEKQRNGKYSGTKNNVNAKFNSLALSCSVEAATRREGRQEGER